MKQKRYHELLKGNKEWVSEVNNKDPKYFEQLADAQKPAFLWIGCSDSRVPANQITGTLPGEIFVHRNIANLVVPTDLNMLSVLEYAVEVLKVKHVIVCGHYGCGGVQAALSGKSFGLIDNWLINIKNVYRIHEKDLLDLPEKDIQDKMTELNVIEQAYNISKTPIIQRAWKKDNAPAIHGWIYNLKNGLIKELLYKVRDESKVPDIYKFK